MRQRRSTSVILAAVLLAGCATHYRAQPAPGADDRTGAAVVNVWYVPGRALMCGGSALLAGAVLTLTLGQDYEGPARLMHGGCAGPWTVGAKEVRNAVADQ
jgi:uncharacterized lipoprotein YbaY